ncbi:MAG: tRNA epoxyqueuosine(34) reductase QueG [Planctomycetes bacterium]|nr:tRNA epoxyqueuosine(34) reductase QueG [Planctomycetota bacterium]
MLAAEMSRVVKSAAIDVGFDRCGIAPATPIGRADYFRDWLDAGHAGSMEYLHHHFSQRADPSKLLDQAKSVIVVSLLYNQEQPRVSVTAGQPRGRVAMYAWGDDYHDVIKKKLHQLADGLRKELPVPAEFKACVDTAPLLEREVAVAGGIGWIGKNTMVLDHGLGSYFFLGALITTLDLAPDDPLPDRCGTCTACLDACPTDAFIAPYQMDASRCISYLTIEHRTEISEELEALMDDWVFGCDVCQQVCPYNARAPMTREPRFAVRHPAPQPPVLDIIGWSVEDYRKQLRGSAGKRAKLPMWQRNAKIALRNAAQAADEASPGA